MLRTLLVLGLLSGCLGASPQRSREGSPARHSSVDCSGTVGFSAVGLRTLHHSGLLSYSNALLDNGVAFNKETGEVTIHCSGVYQITFAAYGDDPNTRVLLKTRRANKDWSVLVSAGGPVSGGGSNQVLIHLHVGDQAALWLSSGRLTSERHLPSTTFSAFKLTK